MSCKAAEAVNDIFGAVGWRVPNDVCKIVQQVGLPPQFIVLVQSLLEILCQDGVRQCVSTHLPACANCVCLHKQVAINCLAEHCPSCSCLKNLSTQVPAEEKNE